MMLLGLFVSRSQHKGDKMSIKNRPYFVRADKWNDFLNHKTDDETLERCKRIDRMINMDVPVINNRSEDREHQEVKGENMVEQRLINANMMVAEESEAYMSAQTSGKISCVSKEIINVIHRKIQQLIADTPTVDLETLPIVQKLREELARVTAERDAAVKELEGVVDAVNEVNDFIDAEIYSLIPYDKYNALRYNVDAISIWVLEKEWRGAKEG